MRRIVDGKLQHQAVGKSTRQCSRITVYHKSVIEFLYDRVFGIQDIGKHFPRGKKVHEQHQQKSRKRQNQQNDNIPNYYFSCFFHKNYYNNFPAETQ